jgi:hypothetical protein
MIGGEQEMDINLKVGEVNVKGTYVNKILVPNETTIQLTDTIALKYVLNKDKNTVSVSVVNTLFDQPEQQGEINRENFEKMLKGGMDMFTQLGK